MTDQIERYATYKTYAGCKYHLNFPDEWILNELPHTGRQCWNCVGHGGLAGYATWRSIIIGYCANCAIDYDGQRGRGFLGFGIENKRYVYESAFDLYLGDIDFENYGEVADNPEDTMENKAEYLEEFIADYVNEDPDDDDRSEPDYYYEDDDYFGECLKIGCGKACETMSAYCSKHARIYDK
jgi:hypothetical protein